MRVDRVRIDTHEFVTDVHRSVLSGNSGHHRFAVIEATTALARWRGEPYAELRDDDFAQGDIVRLDEYRMLAIEQRSSSLSAQGRAREAIPDLERAVRRYPLREAVSISLASAHHWSGAAVDALRVPRAFERSLAEVGLEPSPALDRWRSRSAGAATHRWPCGGDHRRLAPG